MTTIPIKGGAILVHNKGKEVDSLFTFCLTANKQKGKNERF